MPITKEQAVQRQAMIARAKELRKQGLTFDVIAARLQYSSATIRQLLRKDEQNRIGKSP